MIMKVFITAGTHNKASLQISLYLKKEHVFDVHIFFNKQPVYKQQVLGS